MKFGLSKEIIQIIKIVSVLGTRKDMSKVSVNRNLIRVLTAGDVWIRPAWNEESHLRETFDESALIISNDDMRIDLGEEDINISLFGRGAMPVAQVSAILNRDLSKLRSPYKKALNNQLNKLCKQVYHNIMNEHYLHKTSGDSDFMLFVDLNTDMIVYKRGGGKYVKKNK